MAFPTVVSALTTNGTTAGTTAAVTVPADGTYAAGDLLIILHRCAVAGAIAQGPETVEMFDASADAADDQMALYYRWCDGAEAFGGAMSLSQGSGKYASLVYLIRGADPLINPQLSTVATGTGTAPDPTTCTPTGGAKDYLWLWLGGWENEQTSPPTGTPTNFTNAIGADSGIAGAVTTNCRVASARRELNAASLDAGSWTISVSDDWTAYLMAVHPLSAVPRVPRFTPYPQLLAH